MGSPLTKQSSEYHYALRNRDKAMAFNLVDNFNYPPKPPDDVVNKQFLEILAGIDLSAEQEDEVKLQPPEIKWKLICRHKHIVEQNEEIINNAADSEAQAYVEGLKVNPSLQHLESIREWFENAKPDDVKSFLIFDGVNELLNVLEVSEMCSRKNKDISKQLVILKTLENMINNDQILEILLQNPNTAFIIIKNFNLNYVDLCTSALEVLTAFCWISNEGHSIVINALNKLKEERNYKYPFECLIEGLRKSKNIILIENIITFINTLTESPLEEEERTLMRSQFVSCGLKRIYEDIKEKIATEKFSIEDCIFDNSLKIEETAVNISRLSYSGKTSYIEKNQDEFEKHLLQIINQIEVFEKAVDDYGVMELNPESQNELQKMGSQSVDFTDINSIFEKLKNESMTNQSFPSLLSIMQQLLIIPRNEKGRELWGKIADILTKTTGIDSQEGILKISDLKNILGNTMNVVEMEEKIENLEMTLKSREEEIKKLTNEKNKFDSENQKIKREIEKAEQVLKTFQVINTEFEKKLEEAQKRIKELEAALAKSDSNKATGSNNDAAKIAALEAKIANLEKQVSAISEKDAKIAELEKKLSESSGQTGGGGGPPPLPPNLLGGGGGGPPPLPPNLLGGSGPPPLPPNLLGGGGGPPPLPPNLLGGGGGGPPPLPPNLLGGGGGPPLLPPNLLGGGGGGPPLLPPNLLGGGGGPPPMNLLGGPPPLKGGLPGLAQVVQQVKEKKKPRIPLKGLMWTVIAMNNIKESVWEKIDDTKVELDVDFLEKEFATKKPVETAVAGGKKLDEKPKVQKISLLPPEKTKNLEIVLGKLKLSNTALVEALFSLDEKILTINTVESLLGVLPSEDEIKMVLSYEGDPDLLANPEKFVLEISGVPGFQQRLQALKFTKTYRELVSDLTDKMDKVMSVLSHIPNDKTLMMLLENILAIGNYLNGTTARGGAYGFKLDALEKLADMKMTTNPKKNLLMYVIERLESKSGKTIIDPNDDLSAYEIGSKLPLMQLQSDLGEIRKGAKSLENAIKKQTDHTSDKVEKFFKDPNAAIGKIIEKIDKDLKTCEEDYQKSCKFLCENPKDTSSDKLIEKIYRFWINCKNAKTAIIKEKELAQKEEEKKKKLDEKNMTKTEGQNTLTNMAGLKMGNPDEIVEVLRNRRQTKKNLNIGLSAGLTEKAEGLKKPPVGGAPLGGMQMMQGFAGVQLRKVEKPEDKKSISGPSNVTPSTTQDNKNQNLAHLSNIMVQGAIRKKTINKNSFIPAIFQNK